MATTGPLSPLFDHCGTLAAFPITDDQMLYGGCCASSIASPGSTKRNPWPWWQTICREMAGTIRNSRLYKKKIKAAAHRRSVRGL